MSPGCFHLSTRSNGVQPVAQGGMSCIGRSPIDCVHLLPVTFDGHINEVSWAREARTAPNNIGSSSRIPRCDFCDDSFALDGIGEIGADIMELLLKGIGCLGLYDR